MLTAKTWLRSIAAACFVIVPAVYFAGYTNPAEAQSFDCSRASTPVETLICRNASLGDLDTKLSQLFHERLVSNPAQRERLLADERNWVVQRDKQCMVEAGKTATSDQLDCLTGAYRDRLAVLQADAGNVEISGGGSPNQALCQAIGQKYRAFMSSAKTSDPSFDPQEVLRNLGEQKSSGVSVADWVMDEVDGDKIVAWATKQNPPLSIPPEIVNGIKGNGTENLTLDHPPGSDIYVVNGTAGTLFCYGPGVYFRAENGRAVPVAGPQGWYSGDSWESGASCMVLRSVGTVDGAAAMFEETKNTSRIGDYSVNVVPWREDHFEAGCTATFRFSQRFVALDWRNPANEPDQCNGSDCGKLKAAAWQLAGAVQAHAEAIAPWRKTQIASLTAAQARQFKTMVAAAASDTDKEAISTADDASVQSPLLLPLVEGGKLYLAKVGHLQFHDAYLPGWKIILQHLTDGQLDEDDQVSFELDMQSDRLLGVTIK